GSVASGSGLSLRRSGAAGPKRCKRIPAQLDEGRGSRCRVADLDDACGGSLADPLAELRVAQCPHESLDQRVDVSPANQEPALLVLDDLGHAPLIAADDRGASGHRLQADVREVLPM